MKTLIKYLLVIVLISSCTDFIDTYDGWEINAGKHYSHRSGLPKSIWSPRNGSRMRFDAYFDQSCLYTEDFDGDINKLYGFTDCNSTVHKNSARFGWRSTTTGKIEIFAYWYVNGTRGFYKMGETLPYKQDQYYIQITDEEYGFSFNGLTYSVKRYKNCKTGVRTRLFPYFGGNKPAPHDMKIFIYEYD